MYYVIADDGSFILDVLTHRPTEAEVQELANDFACAVWILQGQHAGLTAEPASGNDKEK